MIEHDHVGSSFGASLGGLTFFERDERVWGGSSAVGLEVEE